MDQPDALSWTCHAPPQDDAVEVVQLWAPKHQEQSRTSPLRSLDPLGVLGWREGGELFEGKPFGALRIAVGAVALPG